jgi:hypothetical protein
MNTALGEPLERSNAIPEGDFNNLVSGLVGVGKSDVTTPLDVILRMLKFPESTT